MWKQTPSQICARLLQAFPQSLAADVQAVAAVLPGDVELHPEFQQALLLDDEALMIPGRVYGGEVQAAAVGRLSAVQKTILHGLYLKHCSGFVRQKYLQRILAEQSRDHFLIPYVFHLLGEYVLEILVLADAHIDGHDLARYRQFMAENPVYARQSESRMISYWNCYYRRQFPDLERYIGRRIFKKLKSKQI